ncbi:hypothetical protein [Paenibacillus gallinarum]|uniref:Uncharacterized protein n=1 Tax=Paenibacillus gallinarum TaxID=2762232 RepID=A0ABR8T3S0_9BACL|nr:hypothetical protein [Paenibacillus gallinarum]MBD7970347.1 hypothetical protein [Paenibacillus gallinarum]
MYTTVKLNNYLIPQAKVTLQEDRKSSATSKNLRSYKIECSLSPKEYEIFEMVVNTWPLQFSVVDSSSNTEMNVFYLEKSRSFIRGENNFRIYSVILEFEVFEDERNSSNEDASTLFNTQLNILKTRALVSLLEEKGILEVDEHDNRAKEVIKKELKELQYRFKGFSGELNIL